MTDKNWISTGKANKIFNQGIDDRTFRDNFRDCVQNHLTPGGQFRWFRPEVEQLRDAPKDKAS